MTANSIRLIGNASALMSKQRRGTILFKINSSGALSSMASEDFPDAGKFLFGEGFEARIKTRCETAKTLLRAAQVGQRSSQFFRGRTTQFRKRGVPNHSTTTITSFADHSRAFQQLPGFQTSSSNTTKLISSPSFLSGMGINLFPMHVNHLPLAGRLKHCLTNWELITSDPGVLETVRGLKLIFLSPPYQAHPPQQVPQTEQTKQLINLEIQGMLEKGAV